MAEFAAQTMKDPRGYLTPEQVEQLIGASANLRDRLILQLMYRCGRRVSEVLLLTGDDILWDDRKLIFTILKRKKPVKELKPVDEETLDLLEKYMKESGEIKGIRKRMQSGGRLFPVSRQYVFKMVRQLGAKTGITHVGKKKIHPHILRHSFAVHAVRTSVKTAEDLRKLQMYMGHANIATTSHYLQFSPEEQRSLIEGMFGKKAKK